MGRSHSRFESKLRKYWTITNSAAIVSVIRERIGFCFHILKLLHITNRAKAAISSCSIYKDVAL
jgi:hypothetical protein